MSVESRRSIKTAQLGMRELNFSFDGSDAAPAAASFDSLQISSITKNAVGDYTIIFTRPFELNPMAFCQVVGGSNRVVHISAVDVDRVTIKTYRRDTGDAADAELYVNVKGCDHRFNY